MSVEIRKEVADICHLVYERGMVCGSGGNISAKYEDKIFITPSGYSLCDMKPEDIVEVTLDGHTSGTVKPSMELFLHMRAYQVRPDINVVVHVHSLYATIVGAMTEEKDLDKPMPPYTPGYVMKVKNLKTVPFFVPGSLELAESIGQGLKESDTLLMKNHGIVIISKDFKDAFNIAEEIEQNARIHTILRGKGSLSDNQVAAILEGYK